MKSDCKAFKKNKVLFEPHIPMQVSGIHAVNNLAPRHTTKGLRGKRPAAYQKVRSVPRNIN